MPVLVLYGFNFVGLKTGRNVNSYSVDLIRRKDNAVRSFCLVECISLNAFPCYCSIERFVFEYVCVRFVCESKGMISASVQFRFVGQSPVTPTGGGGDWPAKFGWESRNVSSGLLSDHFLNCQFSVVIGVKISGSATALLGTFTLNNSLIIVEISVLSLCVNSRLFVVDAVRVNLNLNDQPMPAPVPTSAPQPPPSSPPPTTDDEYAADDEPEYESIESEIQLRPTLVFDNTRDNADGVWIEEATASSIDAPSFGFAIGVNGADANFARTLALGGLQSVEGFDAWPPPADAELVGLLVEYKSNVASTRQTTYEFVDDPLRSGLQITPNAMMRPRADPNGIMTEACYGRSLVAWSQRARNAADKGVGSIGALRSLSMFDGLTADRWV
jgi:hypothetical protein